MNKKQESRGKSQEVRSKRGTRFFVSLLLVSLLLGCQQIPLHHNLKEIEADEILVFLDRNGIVAKKGKEISGQTVTWTVFVGKGDVGQARQILIANNLPRRRELGLSGVYKEKGLIPTPDEQKARFLLALKGEIINSLLKIPEVVDVDVVLNIPVQDDLSEMDPVKKRPTASVVVKSKGTESARKMTEGKIQRFVANTVPNLNPNDVTVILSHMGSREGAGHSPETATSRGDISSPLSPLDEDEGISYAAPSATGTADFTELAGVRMDEESVGLFKFYIVGLLFLLMGVSLVLLLSIVRLNRMRLKVQTAVPMSHSPAIPGGEMPGLLGEGEGTYQPGGVDGTFNTD